VAEAWIGPRPSPDHVVAHHPNPDKADCRSSNISYASRAENMAQWLATCPQFAGGPKLNAAKVRELRRLKAEGWSNTKLADRYGVGLDCVRNVVIRASWKSVA
jgi:hypothetical protein